jgi:hypothetical protein
MITRRARRCSGVPTVRSRPRGRPPHLRGDVRRRATGSPSTAHARFSGGFGGCRALRRGCKTARLDAATAVRVTRLPLKRFNFLKARPPLGNAFGCLVEVQISAQHYHSVPASIPLQWENSRFAQLRFWATESAETRISGWVRSHTFRADRREGPAGVRPRGPLQDGVQWNRDAVSGNVNCVPLVSRG